MEKVMLAQQAIKYLASVCDGAYEKDGCGFNGTDSRFGKSLAGQERWTSRQAEAAIKMLKKYRKQLQKAGFNPEELEGLFDGKPIERTAAPTREHTRPTVEKKAVLDNGLVKITFPFDYGTLDIVKSIPGRKFHNKENPKYWTAPVEKKTVQILVENGFDVAPEITQTVGNPDTPVEIKPIDVLTYKKTLFPYQKEGVAFIESRKGRALLGDEMGLGKTIQALAWLELHPESRPAVIVCPAHLKINWAREAKSGLSKADVEVLSGEKPYPITSRDIIIINYDILPNKYTVEKDANGKKRYKEIPGTGWVDHLIKIKPQVMVFDEAHYIKNNSAFRTKGTKKLAKSIPHVIAISGTPIVNRPIEGWNILQILDRTIFPNFVDFTHTYCDAKHNGFGWDYTGASNKEKLHKILTETVMIRRKKADVLPELPSKLYSFIPMEMDNRKEYQKAMDNFIDYLKETKGVKAANKAKAAEHLVRIEGLKQLAVKGKMKHAVNWIRDFLEENGNKLVVFAVHKTVIDGLMKEFKDIAVKVDGGLTAQQRDDAVQAFQDDPKVKLFVGNIQAAGTGLTLTAASAVAFVELPWTPGDLVQAEDRCHRIGQEDTVNVYYLLADRTIEEDIADLLDQKREVVEAILDGKEVEGESLLTALINKYREAK